MYQLVEIDRVELNKYPDISSELECVLREGLTIGDLHADARKLIYIALKHGIFQIAEGDYLDLIKTYEKGRSGETISSQEYEEFKLKLRSLSGPRYDEQFVRLLGDEVAERNCRDDLVLETLGIFKRTNTELETLFSNHGLEFVKHAEQNFSDPLTVDPDQFGSLKRLYDAFDNGSQNREYVQTLIHDYYKPTLKLLSYNLRENNTKITIFSHAPIGRTKKDLVRLLKSLAKKLNINSIENLEKADYRELANLIDQINQRFKYFVDSNAVSTLVNPGAKGVNISPEVCPITFLTWNRNHNYFDEPSEDQGDEIVFVHGHDSKKGAKNLINLDNYLGKDNDAGKYNILLHPQKLRPQLQKEQETNLDKIFDIALSSDHTHDLLPFLETTELKNKIQHAFARINKPYCLHLLNFSLKHELLGDTQKEAIHESHIFEATSLGCSYVVEAICKKHPNVERIKKAELSEDDSDEDTNDLLHQAVVKGGYKVFEILFRTGKFNINKQNKSGDTLLHLAVENGRTEIIDMILEHKDIDYNKRNKTKETAFFIAIKIGHVDIMKRLAPKYDINNRIGPYNQPPLLVAATYRHLNAVEFLLSIENIDESQVLTILKHSITKQNDALFTCIMDSLFVKKNSNFIKQNSETLLSNAKECCEMTKKLFLQGAEYKKEWNIQSGNPEARTLFDLQTEIQGLKENLDEKPALGFSFFSSDKIWVQRAKTYETLHQKEEDFYARIGKHLENLNLLETDILMQSDPSTLDFERFISEVKIFLSSKMKTLDHDPIKKSFFENTISQLDDLVAHHYRTNILEAKFIAIISQLESKIIEHYQNRGFLATTKEHLSDFLKLLVSQYDSPMHDVEKFSSSKSVNIIKTEYGKFFSKNMLKNNTHDKEPATLVSHQQISKDYH